MEILNNTPFATAPVFWEDVNGQAKLTVLIKCTFSIKEAKPLPPDEQLPIFTEDKHYNEDPLSSIRFESDMVPFKPRADVVLVGKAYSPGGKPAKQLDVSLRVGPAQKTIRVFGERYWQFANRLKMVPSISSPMPFFTMDLIYENAFGGIDPASAAYCSQNMHGKGVIGKKTPKSINGRPLPNLEDPYELISSWKSRPKPACFGFYPRGAMPRLKFAGTYNDHYRENRAPELPEDFSYEIFNGAHPNLQIIGYLRGDEPVELVNLSKEPLIRFNLPGIKPKVSIFRWSVDPDEWIEKNVAEDEDISVDRIPKEEQTLEPHLDTIVFIPDEGIFYEVFRAVCTLKNLDSPEIAAISITQ